MCVFVNKFYISQYTIETVLEQYFLLLKIFYPSSNNIPRKNSIKKKAYYLQINLTSETLSPPYRYLAVTQPLIYSRRRRSKRLAGLMIIIVWILAGAITSPPLLGCFPRARNAVETEKKCSYNMDSSYVIFSAMGSFFLPMLVMLYVYGRISCVIAKRHRSLESTDAVSAGDYHKNSKQKGLAGTEPTNYPRAHRRSQRRHFHAVSSSGEGGIFFSVALFMVKVQLTLEKLGWFWPFRRILAKRKEKTMCIKDLHLLHT